MILDIVKIGNSQGIRIPKNILEECGISEQIDIEVKIHSILIKPVNPRKNWAESFKKMRENEDDKMLIDDNIDLENEDGEWEW